MSYEQFKNQIIVNNFIIVNEDWYNLHRTRNYYDDRIVIANL